ncbi:MAG: hypothetical protein JSV94_04270 [Methanobacteriota archaeon]|nr:MAG: hypothetical protein JSV94_04270 [Euryarchaeota archaeon]
MPGDADGQGISPRSKQRVIEAELSWISSLVLFFSTVYVVLKFDVLWMGFGIFALSLYVLPIVTTRDPFKAIPWEITILLSSPMILHISEGSRMMSDQFAWWDDFTSLAFAFSLSTIGFLLTVELEMYTSIRMNRPFSIFFVVMFTLSESGFWMLALYVGDSFFGTTNLLSNDDVMREFSWILIGGILMGFLYAAYIRAMSEHRSRTLGFINVWEVKG